MDTIYKRSGGEWPEIPKGWSDTPPEPPDSPMWQSTRNPPSEWIEKVRHIVEYKRRWYTLFLWPHLVFRREVYYDNVWTAPKRVGVHD